MAPVSVVVCHMKLLQPHRSEGRCRAQRRQQHPRPEPGEEEEETCLEIEVNNSRDGNFNHK